MLGVSLVRPSFAHQTETASNIGATLHIEPNDIPKAGEPSLTWFALTRRGGRIVPLSACDCSLTVYALPDNQPIAEPTLEAVSAEGYDSIPGALIEFPQIGAYELVLTGRPTTDEDFDSFEFRFEVTVATGTSRPSQQSDASPSEDSAAQSSLEGDASSDDASSNATSTNETTTAESPLTIEQDLPTATTSAPSLSPALVIGVVVLCAAIAAIGITIQRGRQQHGKTVNTDDSSGDD